MLQKAYLEAVVERWPEFKKGAKELYKSEGIVGVEIEVENCWIMPAGNYDDYRVYFWANAKDGSLRHQGVEWISVPMTGEGIVVSLNFLKTYLKVQEPKYKPVQFSDLCGSHVHLNVRDFSVEHFGNLVFLYTVFEDSLLRIAGDRSRNIFCLPVSTTAPALRQFLSTMDDPNKAEKNIQELIYGTDEQKSKYAAFNYVPVNKLGTVEFRQMEGHLDVPRWLHWISLILLLRDAALRYPFVELRKEVFALNTNSEYEKFAKGVFKDWFQYIDNSTVWNEMAGGVRKLKALSIPAREIYVDDVKGGRPPREEEELLLAPKPRPARIVNPEVRVGRDDERGRWGREFARVMKERDAQKVVPPQFNLDNAMKWMVHDEVVHVGGINNPENFNVEVAVPAPKPIKGQF